MPAPSFPFGRPLYPPSHVKGPTTGQDVVAVKIMTSRAGYWPWQEFDNVYNNAFAHGIKGKGKRYSGIHGMKAALGISFAGDTFDKWIFNASLKLRVPAGQPNEGEWAWSARARFLYTGFDDVSAEEKIVSEIFRWWSYLTAREPDVHYSQVRPSLPIYRKIDPPVFPLWLDCSSCAIYMAFLGGAKSPDPYGYTGYGNTNSLQDRGFRISRDKINDYCKDHYVLAFYGPSMWNSTHVVAVKSPTQVYSHGREAGPNVYDTVMYRGDLLEIRAYEVI